MRAAVYLRQSLDRNGSGAAVSRQREDCRALAAARGWEVVREYCDNDVSASSRKPRPEYRRMLTDAGRDDFGVVVAWHVDRLARRLVDLEELIDQAGRTDLKIATVNGDLDLSNDTGRLVGRILASVAAGEVERKGARQARARLQAATEGRPPGGWRAFGYDDNGLTVRRAESRLVKLGYRRLLAGGSLRGIAGEWNMAGATSTKGRPWRPDSVRSVLLNARNAGLSTYRGEVVGNGRWPGIVDEATWRAACAIFADPSRRTTPDTRRRYLLSGLASCGRCGALVDTGRTQHGVRTYKCSAHRHLARGAQPVDDLIAEVVIGRLSRPDARDLLVDEDAPDADALREEAQALRTRLDDLAGLYAAGAVTASQLATGTVRLRERLTIAETRLADTARVAVLGDVVGATDVGKTWSRLDVDRQRRVVDTLMEITLLSVGRGNRTFDPAQVAIEWRSERASR